MKTWQPEDIKKLRKWTGKNQTEAAESIGVKQSTWSGVESGKDSLSARLMSLYIDLCTPTVLFITGNQASLIATAMVAVGQVEAITTDLNEFNEILKTGKHIAVLAEEEEFLLVIEKAEQATRLNIPVRGLEVSDNGVRVIEIKKK